MSPRCTYCELPGREYFLRLGGNVWQFTPIPLCPLHALDLQAVGYGMKPRKEKACPGS